MERTIILLSLLALAQSKLLNLSCKEIRLFVDGHNSRRLRLAKGEVSNQPPASEMKFMVWDEELAAKAADWASRNKFVHNPNKKIGSNRFDTGENLYTASSSNPNFNFDPNQALEAWFNEHKDYKYGPIKDSDFDGSTGVKIGHYTQMAWSDSTHVGCAISQKMENQWNKVLVVCNYGPGGNFMGQTPYRAGKASGNLVCGTKDCSRPYGNC